MKQTPIRAHRDEHALSEAALRAEADAAWPKAGLTDTYERGFKNAYVSIAKVFAIKEAQIERADALLRETAQVAHARANADREF